MNDYPIWHPYTQHGILRPILPVSSAQGAYLYLEDGTKLIDAISSWWVNIHGHGHPDIVQAIAEQAANLDHVIFAGFTHKPAKDLADLLLSKCHGFKKVFYSDNGSTAVEVALKLSYQFHQRRGDSGRSRFLALRNSYHGDTFGAMAVSEPESFHAPFRKLLPRVDFVSPDDEDELKQLLHNNPGAYAAFIVEPLVQGAEGMRMYSASYLRAVSELCRENGILLICDEVFTGFYRTGKMFAFEHAGIEPDIACLSKGITGGFLPLSVTLVTENLYSSFLSENIKDAFLHGHSYTANPIACSAAVASFRLLETKDCQQRIQMISARTKHNIERFKSHPQVKNARSLGTIGAIELPEFKDPSHFVNTKGHELATEARKRGILLRPLGPLGNIIYTVPPYCIEGHEIDYIYDVILELL